MCWKETLITFTTGASVDDKLYESFMSALASRDQERARRRYVQAMYALAAKKPGKRPSPVAKEHVRGTNVWSGPAVGARAVRAATS